MEDMIKTIEGLIAENQSEKVRSPHLDVALGRLHTAVDNLRALPADMAKHAKAIVKDVEAAVKPGKNGNKPAGL
jgi:hypothetical protein